MTIEISSKDCRTNNQACFRKLELFLKANPIPDKTTESEVRRLLLPFVENKLKPGEWILYDGNTVYNVKRLTKQFKALVCHYDYDNFTKYLYQFFTMSAGSISHYNQVGWFNIYPDLDSLKNFFRHNEYGEPVKGYPPSWHYDARQAAEAMHAVLFGVGTKYSYPHY